MCCAQLGPEKGQLVVENQVRVTGGFISTDDQERLNNFDWDRMKLKIISMRQAKVAKLWTGD